MSVGDWTEPAAWCPDLMSTPATDAVLVRADGPVVRLTLNRPGKRNALSLELMEDLLATLRRLGKDPGVRAIVIDSTQARRSPRVTTSTEMVGRDVPFYQRLFDVCKRAHGDHPPCATTGHRKGRGDGDGGGLPACRRLRPGGGRRWGTLCHSGREDRPFCSTPMVPLLARDRPQACAGDAAHRPADHRRHRARLGTGESRSSRWRRSKTKVNHHRRRNRGLQPTDRRYRQGGVLRPDRTRRTSGIRPRRRPSWR